MVMTITGYFLLQGLNNIKSTISNVNRKENLGKSTTRACHKSTANFARRATETQDEKLSSENGL